MMPTTPTTAGVEDSGATGPTHKTKQKITQGGMTTTAVGIREIPKYKRKWKR
jgi:hypothetical protein